MIHDPPLEDHPKTDDLARLVESGSRSEPWIAEHLAGCQQCMAVFAEFVEIRSRTIGGVEPAPANWIARGLAVAAEAPQSRRGNRRLRLAFGIPAAIAAAAAVVMLAGQGVERAGLERKRGLVADQMRNDSHGGLLYAPDLLPTPRGVRGSTPVPGMEETIDELTRRYEEGARSAEDAFWLVSGFLSRDDLNNADAYLEESIPRFPEDDRFHNLAAILAYKRNNLKTAARHLEKALELRRSPTNLYNLAVVRRAAGDSSAASALVQEILEHSPGSPVLPLAADMMAAPPGES